ncbi:MAG: hypothetical protein Q9174_005734 [Haloplaca sp. 1 TL-2023]
MVQDVSNGPSHGNGATVSTARWVPEPDGRGTWSLLTTCIITISLCVWSAVHLNVPQHQSQHSKYWRKFKWVLLGLFAPELVAYVAWQQRREASQLGEWMGKLYGQEVSPSKHQNFWLYLRSKFRGPSGKVNHQQPAPISPGTRHPTRSQWELVHGFFAIMGGFTYAQTGKTKDFLPNGGSRAALTVEGIKFLLSHEPDALPDITADQIKDKSKADGLKKTVVCVQALWFCIQCLTRWAQSLPVSLLELNTLGHALCTLVIYLLWWHKPLDIEEPSLITDPALADIFAYMWMTSRVSANGFVGYDIGGMLRDEFDCIWPFENPVLSDLLLTPRTPDASDPATFLPSMSKSHLPGKYDTLFRKDLPPIPGRADYSSRRYASSGYRILRLLVSLKVLPQRILKQPPGLFTRTTAIDHFSPHDASRWSLAHSAITRYDLEYDLRQRHATPFNGRRLRSRLALRQRNIVLDFQTLPVVTAIAVSGALYGSLHLLAWNTPFPSPIESLLWKISALCVTCNGLVGGACGGPVVSLHAARRAAFQVSMLGRARKSRTAYSTREQGVGGRKAVLFSTRVFWIPFFALGVLALPVFWFSYVLGRVYLVVESFRAVAFLGDGAFETVEWPDYLPHIT